MRRLSIILFVISFSICSKEIEFCYNDPMPISRVRTYAQSFLIKGETASITTTECVVVAVENNRDELIKKIILQKYPGAIVNDLAVEGIGETGRMCEMIVEEENLRDVNATQPLFNIGLNKQHHRDLEKLDRQSSLLVSEGKYATIMLNGNMMVLKCTRLSPTPIVEIFYQTMESGISTTVTVPVGTKKEIGSIVEDLAKRQKNLSLDKGPNGETTEGQKFRKISLIVKPQIERH